MVETTVKKATPPNQASQPAAAGSGIVVPNEFAEREQVMGFLFASCEQKNKQLSALAQQVVAANEATAKLYTELSQVKAEKLALETQVQELQTINAEQFAQLNQKPSPTPAQPVQAVEVAPAQPATEGSSAAPAPVPGPVSVKVASKI